MSSRFPQPPSNVAGTSPKHGLPGNWGEGSKMPKTWDQVKEILALALEQSPEQRAGFIRQACGEDAALRAVPSARSRTNIRSGRQTASGSPIAPRETDTSRFIANWPTEAERKSFCSQTNRRSPPRIGLAMASTSSIRALLPDRTGKSGRCRSRQAASPTWWCLTP